MEGSGQPGDPYLIEGIGDSVMTNAQRLALTGAELWNGRTVITTDTPRRRWEYVLGFGWKCRFQELTTYTPVMTNVSAGAGTVLGHFWREGSNVHTIGTMRLGAGFAIPGAAGWTATLPVTVPAATFDTSKRILGSSWVYDASAAIIYSTTAIIDNSTTTLSLLNASGIVFPFSATSPFVWAAGDEVHWSISYPAAD